MKRLLSLRDARWANLFVVNLRIFIGFAVLPAGLKKVLGQPFTDPDKTGIFHEFLHAFFAAGPLYHLVGAVQLLAALLLMTQRYATLGAALLLPVLVAINALCWSSFGIPTIVVVNLMTLGTLGLLLWDYPKWIVLVRDDQSANSIQIPARSNSVEHGLWQICGLAIFLLYIVATAIEGGVYRPRGVELSNPSFYLLPAIAVFPLVTYGLDRRRRKIRTQAN